MRDHNHYLDVNNIHHCCDYDHDCSNHNNGPNHNDDRAYHDNELDPARSDHPRDPMVGSSDRMP